MALNNVPPRFRKTFEKDFSNGVLDSKGRYQTTIGNLKKMELAMKEVVHDPKYGKAISASGWNANQAATKIKELRLSLLPEESSLKIKKLDKQFAPLVETVEYIIPKILPDRSGALNTQFLFDAFYNPRKSGTRQFLENDFKKLGIDISPEIKTIKGWVKRQQLESFRKKLGERTMEGIS